MIEMKIPHSRPTIYEEDISRVVSNLRSGLIATGDEVYMFENELSAFIGIRGGVATSSGTAALYLALKALDVKEGDEVIIPTYVCNSVLSAVNLTGADAVLADTEKMGYNLSPKSVKENISLRTRAIVVPHLFGIPAKIDEILKFDLPVIEDCAQSIGATYAGKKLGSFGTLSIFSFYATKMMTTGHGGMVVTNSSELLEKLRDLTTYDERLDFGESFNFSLTDFQATLGRSQLKRLDSFVRRRREIAKIYDEAFEDLGLFQNIENSIYFRYVVQVENADKYVETMKRYGIDCEKPVFKPLHWYFYTESEFPNTDRAMTRAVSIPIYPSLTEKEISHIIKTIKTVGL